VVLKIPKSAHFLTAQSTPINPSTTPKALYRFNINSLNPVTTYQTLGHVTAVAVYLANNWIAVSFTDTTIIHRQFFDLTLTDPVVSTPLLTHVKSHRFREVSMVFSPVSPVYIVAYNNIVETLDTATDNTIIHTKTITEISVIHQMLIVPHSYFAIVSSNENLLVITNYLQIPVSIPIEIITIGFTGLVEMAFFEKQKLLIISGNASNLVVILEIEKYLCDSILRVCPVNPNTLADTSCTPGAVLFNEKCRC
jgi:hypothetical protein